MRVSIEDIPTVDLGNKGVLLRIKTAQNKSLGKLWIGQAHIRWARGNVPDKNAKKLTIQEFVDFLNELP